MQSVQEKYKNLQEYLKSLGSVAVAFSSGVDSTFLLACDRSYRILLFFSEKGVRGGKAVLQGTGNQTYRVQVRRT